MQGNLSEIDICSILQLIAQEQQTGLLYIETHHLGSSSSRSINLLSKRKENHAIASANFANSQNSPTSRQSWMIFCDRGCIVYATEVDVNDINAASVRLDDYLRHYRVRFRPPVNNSISSLSPSQSETSLREYEDLWMLLRQDIINTNQARTILTAFIQEVIFDVFSLTQGWFVFTQGLTLTPKLAGFEITPILRQIRQQIQSWHILFPHIQSPQQLPQMRNSERVRACLPSTTIQKLQRWADGKTSLRRLSRMLNRDILTIGKAIYPYVQQGFVQLVLPPSESSYSQLPFPPSNLPRLAWIGEEISPQFSLLLAQGYEAIAIPNPFDTLLRLFDAKPNLILINTRNYDEKIYDLCGMLRHSQSFKFIPIIILCPEDGYINRVRAQISGATDFLKMPCQDSELLMLIAKNLNHNGYSQHQHQSILVDRDKYKVKNVITESISGDKTLGTINLVNE